MIFPIQKPDPSALPDSVPSSIERAEPLAWIIKLPSGWFRCKENSTHKRLGYTGSIHAKRYPTREAAQTECKEGEIPTALLSKWGRTE